MVFDSTARELGNRLPHSDERAAANQLRTILAEQASASKPQKLTLLHGKGERADIVLTPALASLLTDVLRHIGSGEAVTLVPVGQMLTTQQPADLLNVSRPYLVSLLDGGTIPHVKVGRDRRIRAEDLFDYRRKRDSVRDKALSQLAEIDAKLI